MVFNNPSAPMYNQHHHHLHESNGAHFQMNASNMEGTWCPSATGAFYQEPTSCMKQENGYHQMWYHHHQYGHNAAAASMFHCNGGGDGVAPPILPSPPMTSESDVSSPGGGRPLSPNQEKRPALARSPYEWIRKSSYQCQPTPGKTRTKDKYRVVYTDHQRMELEREFNFVSKYITIRRKSELAASLGLSERQVKIWFQNRRAKERKQKKKRVEETNQLSSIMSSPHPAQYPNSHQFGLPAAPTLVHQTSNYNLQELEHDRAEQIIPAVVSPPQRMKLDINNS